MTNVLDKRKIQQVYRDVQNHKAVEQIIRHYSTNQADIRRVALQSVDLSHSLTVVELGCAFGAFTEALEGRLAPNAHITGMDIIAEYEPFFLQACRKAGYAGSFNASGVHQISDFPPASVDLVICSFALYFFTELIPDIARILKPDGIFITITHSIRNMSELIEAIRYILNRHELINSQEILPIEVILTQFASENGKHLLYPHFGRIEQTDYPNVLIFPPDEIDAFIDYYRFKRPFFLTGTDTNAIDMIAELTRTFEALAQEGQDVAMCKDDSIFVCYEPQAGGQGR